MEVENNNNKFSPKEENKNIKEYNKENIKERKHKKEIMINKNMELTIIII